MNPSYVGPGWYWVEGRDDPTYLYDMACVEMVRIIAHIPRPPPVVNWSAMPAWARYVCMQPKGYWYWATNKPSNLGDHWEAADDHHGMIPKEYSPSYIGDWQNSLAERP